MKKKFLFLIFILATICPFFTKAAAQGVVVPEATSIPRSFTESCFPQDRYRGYTDNVESCAAQLTTQGFDQSICETPAFADTLSREYCRRGFALLTKNRSLCEGDLISRTSVPVSCQEKWDFKSGDGSKPAVCYKEENVANVYPAWKSECLFAYANYFKDFKTCDLLNGDDKTDCYMHIGPTSEVWYQWAFLGWPFIAYALLSIVLYALGLLIRRKYWITSSFGTVILSLVYFVIIGVMGNRNCGGNCGLSNSHAAFFQGYFLLLTIFALALCSPVDTLVARTNKKVITNMWIILYSFLLGIMVPTIAELLSYPGAAEWPQFVPITHLPYFLIFLITSFSLFYLKSRKNPSL